METPLPPAFQLCAAEGGLKYDLTKGNRSEVSSILENGAHLWSGLIQLETGKTG